MVLKIGVVSQKGGVGKSTLCRMIACEYARSGWDVKIADMDTSQSTSYHWQQRRIQAGLEPQVAVEMFRRVADALKIASNYNLMIFDGAPHATQATLQIAQESDLLILPTGNALDDLEPTVRLAHELRQNGIPREKISIAFCRTGSSEAENREASDYVAQTGFYQLPGSIPEKTAYRRASDTGRAATETSHPSTNQRAADLMQAIVERINELTKQEAA